MSDWFYVGIFVIVFLINQPIAVWLYHRRIRRNETIFMRHVRIENPEATIIMSATESSDLGAMKRIKEQLDRKDWE